MNYALSLIFLLAFSIGNAALPTAPQTDTPVQVSVELFLSSTCPHCKKADVFFKRLEKSEPWIKVHRYFINQDKAALQLFYERLKQQKSINFSVPSMFFCGSQWMGFSDEKTTEKPLLEGLRFCYQRVRQEGELSPNTIHALQQWGNASQLQLSESAAPSAWAYIPLIAIMDAFSPCSIFCFIALLAFMWIYPSQKKSQVRVGVFFLVSLGIVHFLQLSEPTLYYQLLPKLKIATALVGLLLVLYVLRDFRKILSDVVITPDKYVYAVIFFTVFAVQIRQQTCLLNMGMVFEQWLVEQTVSSTRQFLYELYYQAFYLLPLVVFLSVYFLMSRYLRLASLHRMLQMAACFIFLMIGVLLVAYSPFMASLAVSMIVLLAALLMGWFAIRCGY